MTRWLEDLLDVFAPTSCVGCKSPGSSICPRCESSIKLEPYPVQRQELKGFSLTSFESVAASAVIAFKDRGRTALKSWLARQLAEGLRCLDEATLVCLPTSRAAFVRRGYRANHLLTQELARQSGYRYQPGVLEFSRELLDQRKLNAAQRADNLRLSLEATRPPSRVILVDDVITTGASLMEARRAIHASGGLVTGFVVFAETLRRT